jgi:hypothetical protein
MIRRSLDVQRSAADGATVASVTGSDLDELANGPRFAFADWPNAQVPNFAAGVYTIWHDDGRFIYVGMSGRSITTTTEAPMRRFGLWTRLDSHAGGRRSGDQFCVYVADRLVLPTLTPDDIEQIASGRHRFDAFVRRYIHQHLSYRFLIVPDGVAARTAEATIRNGARGFGLPLLYPMSRGHSGSVE